MITEIYFLNRRQYNDIKQITPKKVEILMLFLSQIYETLIS